MKRIGLLLLVCGAAVAILLWIVSAPSTLDPALAQDVSRAGDPAAGELVFLEGGCESCHMSADQADPNRLGGGRPLKTPFGVFYPPNISPDPVDGIGAWTAAEFARALLVGVSPAGDYYPAFPYASYRAMKTADIRDLFAYLKTLPPVAGRAPRTQLAFPLNIRRAIGLWKWRYLAEPRKLSAQGPGLGEYIVTGPGHCGECHSPRDVLGGIVAGRELSGAPLLDAKGRAPSLRRDGLKDWSEADIVDALSTGFTPSGDTLGGSMAAVVRNTSRLPKAHLEAIAAYLKTL